MQLYTIDPFAQNPEDTIERLTDARGNTIAPEWSPTSDEIAFLNINNEDLTVGTTNVSSGSIRSLTFTPDWRISVPAWTLDGSYVLYTSAAPDDNTQAIQAQRPTNRSPITIEIVNLNILRVIAR